MPAFSSEELQAVKQANDIVDVVGEYLPLQKKGRSYRAVCPFHDDHDPSLHVDPDRQLYKCFVCGAGGDSIRFVQKMEEISFPEAVLKLAARANIPLVKANTTFKPSPRQQARDILDQYFDFAGYTLQSDPDGKAARYLRARKITPEITKAFRLGWSPGIEQNRRYFDGKKFSQKDLADTGLVNEGNFPVFHDRLLIPIFDARGNPAGITARTLDKDPEIPKYINTGATPLYSKGDLVFNWHRAKTPARKAGRVILVEGAMDVIGLAKAGIEEAVCMLGTACTPKQLDLLKQLQVPVHVFYDSDRAGQKAAYAFGKAAMEHGVPFSMVKPQPEKDPDELFNARGREAVQKAVDSTRSYPEFLFDYLLQERNLDNYEDRRSFAQEIEQAARKLCQDFELAGIQARLRELTGFDFSRTEQIQEKKQQRKPARQLAAPAPAGPSAIEERVLARMLKSRDATLKFYEEIGFFQDPVCARLSLHVQNGWMRQPGFDAATLFETIEDEETADLLSRLLSNPEEVTPFIFEQNLEMMKKRVLNQQIEEIGARIGRTPDVSEKLRLAKEKQALVRKRDALGKTEQRTGGAL